MPAEKAAQSGEVALAGKDGERLGTLVDRSQDKGSDVLYAITKSALTRLMEAGPHVAILSGSLYSADELQRLANALNATIVTGDLMGRSRIREKERKAVAANGIDRFAEQETPWAFLPDHIAILPPEQAVRYFAGLVPTIGVDPARYLPIMQREAFTLARVTETTVLQRVQDLILSRLQTGQGFSTAPHEIESILADAGIAPTNPQYAQMVFRTNAMDAYNVGQTLEVMHDPSVADNFPVWQYLGIDDGRQGEDHFPHFNRYYPSSLPFHTVRGKRVYNCRCTPRYVDKWEWNRLQSQGAILSYL